MESRLYGRRYKTIGPGARKASPRWLEAVTNSFDFRWCIKSLKKLKLLLPWTGHFDLHLYDVLYDICTKLGIADEVVPGHRPTPTSRQPRVRHGLHFALTATANALKKQPASAGLFSAVPSRAVAAGGLHKSLLPAASSAAKCFINDTIKDTVAWDLLQEKGFFDLQQGLRSGLNAAWMGDPAPPVLRPFPLPPLPPSTQRHVVGITCPFCGGGITCASCVRAAEGASFATAPGAWRAGMPLLLRENSSGGGASRVRAAGGASTATTPLATGAGTPLRSGNSDGGGNALSASTSRGLNQPGLVVVGPSALAARAAAGGVVSHSAATHPAAAVPGGRGTPPHHQVGAGQGRTAMAVGPTSTLANKRRRETGAGGAADVEQVATPPMQAAEIRAVEREAPILKRVGGKLTSAQYKANARAKKQNQSGR